MKISTNYNLPNFKAKIDTASVFEVTCMKIFKNEGIEGFKKVVNALRSEPIKATGHRGYAYHARITGDKIKNKYPEIAKASDEITKIINQNPDIKKKDLYEKISPIINRFGETLDIIL